MNNTTITRKIWFSVFPFLAVAAHFILSNILYYSVYRLLIDVLNISQSQFVKFSYLAEMLIYTVITVVFLIIYKLAFRKYVPEQITPLQAAPAFASIIAGVGVSGVSYLWLLVARNFPKLAESIAEMEAGNEMIAGGNTLGLILIVVIAAPIIEELLFRGIVFRSLRNVVPFFVAAFVSAAMFGAYHMNLSQAVYATFMGMMAAVVYEKTNNLLYPILVHMANNAIGVVQSVVPEAGIMIIDIIAVIMIIPMSYFAYKLLTGKCDKCKCNTLASDVGTDL